MRYKATIILLMIANVIFSQSKSDLKRAFTKDKTVKSLELYCKDRAQFASKRDKIIKKLDKLNIDYSFKVVYIKSNSYHFKLNYSVIQNHRRNKRTLSDSWDKSSGANSRSR